jgi:hypothetical protein
MAKFLRTDVALRVLLVWLGVCVTGSLLAGSGLIFYAVFSLPFEMVAVIVALHFGDKIVAQPVRWVAAAIVIPFALMSIVFGGGAFLSLVISVPSGVVFLIAHRLLPLPAEAL